MYWQATDGFVQHENSHHTRGLRKLAMYHLILLVSKYTIKLSAIKIRWRHQPQYLRM